jgi:hypothetical protein
MQSPSLRNEFLSVQFLPEFGGKITSLRSVRTGAEFILPPLNEYAHVLPSDDFSKSDGGGFDECLPSVAPCESIAGASSIPDHGDLWRTPWQIEPKHGEIILHAESISRPLGLRRRATLQDETLILEYDLVNLSNEPTIWLWSAHPLFQVTSGDPILLPDGIEEIEVEYSNPGIFKKGSTVPWPIATSLLGTTRNLSIMPKRDGTTALKFFARMGGSGWCALYRKELGQGLVLRFDPNALPFVGLWICAGAWPAEGVAKQYTVAIEPTTSKADSLEAAVRNQTSRTLNARQHFRWRLDLQLIGGAEHVDFERFSTEACSKSSGTDHAAQR